MPRPRRDSEQPPAKQRMEDAFWTLLEERDYRKITVTDIVRTAQVNRNSFYYHFSGLAELADSAVMHEVERTPLTPVLLTDPTDADKAWRHHIVTMLHTPEQRQRLDRLTLLTGPHSSPELIDSLFDFGRLTLSAMLDQTPDDRTLKTDLILNFAVGGLLAVLAHWPNLSEHIDDEELFDEDVAVLAMGMYLSMSKEDMRTYWNRIFATRADDDSADGDGDGRSEGAGDGVVDDGTTADGVTPER